MMHVVLRCRRRLALGVGLLAMLGGCAGSQANEPQLIQPQAERRSTLGNYLAGRHAERQRDYAAASRFLLEALDAEPDNFDLLARVHGLLINDGRFEDAVEVAKRIVVVSTNHAAANLTLAVSEARDGRAAPAEVRMAALPLTGINRLVTPLTLAWLQVMQDRPAAALNALRSLAEVPGFKPLHDYHAAMINELAGRMDDAAASYRSALSVEGAPSPRIADSAIRFFERRGERQIARELVARNPNLAIDVEASPDSRADRLVNNPRQGLAEALFNVASALRNEQNGALALGYGRLALALQPELPAALMLVGDVLDAQGRENEANEVFARIPRSSPIAFSARIRVAENLSAMGQTEQAVRQLNSLADEQPARIDPLLSLGQIHRRNERYLDAVTAYDRALQRIPALEARHWSLLYARGIALERAKLWPRAEADFLKALELNPDQPDVLNYLAYTWVDRGEHYERAERMLEKAVALRPKSGHIIDSLGWVLYRIGRVEEAVPLLERAVELVPEDPTMLDHLGDAYFRVGRINEARFQWQRALRNKPEEELRVQIERKLERGLEPIGNQRGR
jgi:tetratricopeptide (TPR) repeat protein